MPPKIRRARAPSLALFALAALSAPCAAQFRDARLPEQGRLWLQMAPELLNWTEQFALNSSLDSIADGDRERIADHFGGPLTARMYPAPQALVDALNADAEALGFDPMALDDFSFGDLDISVMRAQVRRLALGGEVGILDWVSVGFRAPFTLADMETRFAFDSTTATIAGAPIDLAPGGSFSAEARRALGDLANLINGGTLSGPDLVNATSLRDHATAFLNALERRASAAVPIPTAPSDAGSQMLGRYADLAAAFELLGFALPELVLPEFSGNADYDAFFVIPGFPTRLPKNSRNGFALGEMEVFARVNLIDQITRREPIPAPTDPGAPPRIPSTEEGIRFRTTIGGLLRVPVTSQNAPPFRDLTNSADVPIGDGQTDIEVALYQDIAVGGWFLLQAAGRYGIQQADAYVVDIVPPDRPYSRASTRTLLFRDLGDYVQIVARPSLRLNAAMRVGLEYDYFRLGDPLYLATDPEAEIEDPALAAAEGAQTRHRFGVALMVDLSEAQGREALQSGARPLRRPWRFGISLRRAVAGSGGRTPASFRFGADFRIPIDIF